MFIEKVKNIALNQNIIALGEFICGDNFVAKIRYASRDTIIEYGVIPQKGASKYNKILEKIDELFEKSIPVEMGSLNPLSFDQNIINWFLHRITKSEMYVLKWDIYEGVLGFDSILFLSIKGELICAISKGSLDDLIKTPSEEVKSASLEKSGSYLLGDTSRVVWITPEEVLSIIPQDLLFKELSKRCENYIRGVFRIPTEFLIHELQIRCKNN